MNNVSQKAAYDRYRRSMVELVERVRAIDVGTFESASSEVLSSELKPQTTSLLTQAHQLVGCVLDACEVAEPPSCRGESELTELAEPFDPFDDLVDGEGTVLDPDSRSRIADIAFVARLELRHRAARLSQLAPQETANFLAECDSALRRVTKALCALDRVISRESSRPAYLDTLSELELGLQVRRCYASFRATIFAHGDACDRLEDVEVHLRRAGHAIAVVVGQPIFGALRLHDRDQLRSLQRRILGWLKSERRLVDGAAVWRDVCAFAAILRHIDRRQELIEHDSLVIRSALRSLAAQTETDESEEISKRVFIELASLHGLDDRVDELVDRGEMRAVVWEPVIERLAQDIGERSARASRVSTVAPIDTFAVAS